MFLNYLKQDIQHTSKYDFILLFTVLQLSLTISHFHREEIGGFLFSIRLRLSTMHSILYSKTQFWGF